MKLVIDASVAVKWFVADRPDEPHADLALALLGHIRSARVVASQPIHWVAEITGVLVRIKPVTVEPAIALLTHPVFKTLKTRASYRRAAALSSRFNHHLFDTLYHAVALEEGATLVTADEAYFAKARGEGGIVRLMDFEVV